MAIETPVSNDFLNLRSSIVLTFDCSLSGANIEEDIILGSVYYCVAFQSIFFAPFNNCSDMVVKVSKGAKIRTYSGLNQY